MQMFFFSGKKTAKRDPSTQPQNCFTSKPDLGFEYDSIELVTTVWKVCLESEEKPILLKQFFTTKKSNREKLEAYVHVSQASLEPYAFVYPHQLPFVVKINTPPGPTLRLLMDSSVVITQSFAALVIQQLCRAVTALDSVNMFHGFINPDNIYVYNFGTGKPVIQLANYGLDIPKELIPVSWKQYIEPERLNARKKSSIYSDVYSVGRIALELLKQEFEVNTTPVALAIRDTITACMSGSITAPELEEKFFSRDQVKRKKTWPVITNSASALGGPWNLNLENGTEGWDNSCGKVSGASLTYDWGIMTLEDTTEKCLYMKKKEFELEEAEFGSVMQTIYCWTLPNRCVRVTAEFKADLDERAFASLWLRCDGAKTLAFQNMTNKRNQNEQPIKGKCDWTQITNTLANIPSGTTFFHFGILFYGSGELYVKNLRLEVDSNWTELPSMPVWKPHSVSHAWALFQGWKDENCCFAELPGEILIYISEIIGTLVADGFNDAKFILI